MIGMGEIKGFGDMKWQKSHELVLEVYKVTQLFPTNKKNRKHGLNP